LRGAHAAQQTGGSTMQQDKHDHPAGTLRFHLENRMAADDGGPAIRVYGPTTDGHSERQLLRFDCFRKDPHYHYDPDGRDEHLNLEGAAAADPVAWSLTQLRQNLPEMVRHAGGSDQAVADSASQAAHAAITQIAAALGRG
jgi:hypothetical protein